MATTANIIRKQGQHWTEFWLDGVFEHKKDNHFYDIDNLQTIYGPCNLEEGNWRTINQYCKSQKRYKTYEAAEAKVLDHMKEYLADVLQTSIGDLKIIIIDKVIRPRK